MENGHVIGKIEIILKEEVLLSLNIMLKQDIEIGRASCRERVFGLV